MNAEEIVKAVIERRPKAGWAIFLITKRKAYLGALARLAYIALFLVLGGALFSDWYISGSIANVPMEYRFGGLILLLAAFFAFVSFVKYIFILANLSKTMIVITDDQVVTSIKGKLKSYPYQHMGRLILAYLTGYGNASYLMPRYTLRFTDLRTNKNVDLDEYNIFGKAQDMYSIIKSKIS